MLVRSFLAVLTLVGVVRLRICTCGAAHVHFRASASVPVEPPPPTPTASDDSGPVHHHHDCGVHKPRPAMSQAVPFSVADAPIDCAVGFLPEVTESAAAPPP